MPFVPKFCTTSVRQRHGCHRQSSAVTNSPHNLEREIKVLIWDEMTSEDTDRLRSVCDLQCEYRHDRRRCHKAHKE
jgi:hypothetical protein